MQLKIIVIFVPKRKTIVIKFVFGLYIIQDF